MASERRARGIRLNSVCFLLTDFKAVAQIQQSRSQNRASRSQEPTRFPVSRFQPPSEARRQKARNRKHGSHFQASSDFFGAPGAPNFKILDSHFSSQASPGAGGLLVGPFHFSILDSEFQRRSVRPKVASSQASVSSSFQIPLSPSA